MTGFGGFAIVVWEMSSGGMEEKEEEVSDKIEKTQAKDLRK